LLSLINNDKTTKCHVSACRIACPPCRRRGALFVARLVINPPPVAVVVSPSLLSLPTASLRYYNAPRMPATLMQGRLRRQSSSCHDVLILRCVHRLSGAMRPSLSSSVIVVPPPPPSDFHRHLPPLLIAMLGKGGRSGLTWRVNKRDGSAVARAVLVEILRFEQQDRPSAGAARTIRESRVSRHSLSRILLGDIMISP
jgi:hypothetical protein